MVGLRLTEMALCFLRPSCNECCYLLNLTSMLYLYLCLVTGIVYLLWGWNVKYMGITCWKLDSLHLGFKIRGEMFWWIFVMDSLCSVENFDIIVPVPD